LPEEERMGGITLPSLGSFLAARYMEKYGTKRESIANVAVKNHHNGSLNPTAHFRYDVSIEDVMNSKIISDPLRLYEFCPISDGSASVLLMKDDLADSFSEKSMKLMDAEIASTTSSISERSDILSLESVKRASQILFKKTGMEARDVDLAELHDMSSILEIVESEAMGRFF
ncbi:MAG: thiolase family protein, partial [Candidatus Thermoplasmatota archaeon]|nr:thiolase family protein [Candidatus Thermoplasmatota archaeon]